jgi:hypothetical protein
VGARAVLKLLAAPFGFGYTVCTMATEPKTTEKKVAVQYVVDDKGKRTAVLVPIDVFEELVELAEQREDIRYLEEAKKEPGEPVPWEQVKAELRAKGKLR